MDSIWKPPRWRIIDLQCSDLFYDIELYPLIMFLDEDIFGEIDVQGLAQVVGTKRLSIDSQDNFIKTLTMIFRSKKLKKLIGALLSQME